MKLLCKGQKPPANGDLVVSELGFRLVKKGEMVEVDQTMGDILLKKYPRNFALSPEIDTKIVEDYSDKQMKVYKKKKEKNSEDLDFV